MKQKNKNINETYGINNRSLPTTNVSSPDSDFDSTEEMDIQKDKKFRDSVRHSSFIQYLLLRREFENTDKDTNQTEDDQDETEFDQEYDDQADGDQEYDDQNETEVDQIEDDNNETEFDIIHGFDDVSQKNDENLDDYDFGGVASGMVNSIDDETMEKIQRNTGRVSKWWKEQVVNTPNSSVLPDESNEKPFVQKSTDIKYQEDEEGPTKIDRARSVYKQLVNYPNLTRSDMIAAFIKQVGVTHSTAVSYYERIAKEFGHTGADSPTKQKEVVEPLSFGSRSSQPSNASVGSFEQEPITPEKESNAPEIFNTSDDPNRQGIIRVVKKAHLVYKRQTEEGNFEELWTYNIGTDMKDDIQIRRAILSGTDIPPHKTQSKNGEQSYTLSTLGNAQLLHITGLSN